MAQWQTPTPCWPRRPNLAGIEMNAVGRARFAHEATLSLRAGPTGRHLYIDWQNASSSWVFAEMRVERRMEGALPGPPSRA